MCLPVNGLTIYQQVAQPLQPLPIIHGALIDPLHCGRALMNESSYGSMPSDPELSAVP